MGQLQSCGRINLRDDLTPFFVAKSGALLSKKLHDQKMPIEKIKEEIIKRFKSNPLPNSS